MGGNIGEFLGRISRRSSGAKTPTIHKTGSETSIDSTASSSSNSSYAESFASTATSRSSNSVKKGSNGGDARWFPGSNLFRRRSSNNSSVTAKPYATKTGAFSKADHELALKVLQSEPKTPAEFRQQMTLREDLHNRFEAGEKLPAETHFRLHDMYAEESMGSSAAESKRRMHYLAHGKAESIHDWPMDSRAASPIQREDSLASKSAHHSTDSKEPGIGNYEAEQVPEMKPNAPWGWDNHPPEFSSSDTASLKASQANDTPVAKNQNEQATESKFTSSSLQRSDSLVSRAPNSIEELITRHKAGEQISQEDHQRLVKHYDDIVNNPNSTPTQIEKAYSKKFEHQAEAAVAPSSSELQSAKATRQVELERDRLAWRKDKALLKSQEQKDDGESFSDALARRQAEIREKKRAKALAMKLSLRH